MWFKEQYLQNVSKASIQQLQWLKHLYFPKVTQAAILPENDWSSFTSQKWLKHLYFP